MLTYDWTKNGEQVRSAIAQQALSVTIRLSGA